MTEQTKDKIDKALDRVLEDLGIRNYEAFISSVDDVILFALCRQFKVVNAVPQLASLETLAEGRLRISSRDSIRRLMDELPEPGAGGLNQVLEFFRELPSRWKKLLGDEARAIRPRGGPDEKLSNPVDIARITDEFFERLKDGGRAQEIKKDIAKRENTSLSTVERRIREERERRAQLRELLERGMKLKIE